MKKTIAIFLFALMSLTQVEAQSIQEARKLTDNEQYENASSVYQSLIAKTPSDANLYYYYGDNLLLSDNADSATMIFEKGKLIDGTNPLIKIGSAKILLDKISVREAKFSSDQDGSNRELRDRYDEALANVQAAESVIDQAILNSKDANILTEAAEALIHYKNKNIDKAKAILDKTLLIDPKKTEALLLYGDIYTELNNGTLAADYYNRALDLDKTSARAIVSKGRLYKRSTNYEGAAREFENAISIEPSYAPAHRELGEAYIKVGKLSQAKEEYKKYLEISKNNCSARIRYATFLFISKSYNDALAELNQVQQRCDSNNLTMLRIQSYCYYETKDTVNGLNTIRRLFQLVKPEKRSAKDLEYYGKFLIATDRDSMILLGIEQLQKSLSLDPSRIDLLTEMATAWSRLKQYPNAIRLLTQKIAINKDVKVQEHLYLGQAYYFNKQFVEADSAVMKANQMSPNWAKAWLYRAKVNAHIDSTSEAGLAKPFYEKYIEVTLPDTSKPDYAAKYNNGLIEAYGYLAYYYILKRDNPNGLVYLKKKLQLPLEPDDKKNVQLAIDQLEGRGPKTKK